ALHGKDPFNGTGGNLMLETFAGVVNLVESKEDHGGIVHVWVKLIVELEIPAAGLHIADFHRPVAFVPDFFAQNPVGSLDDTRIAFGNSGFSKREHGICGVPDGRHARLHAEGGFGMIGNAGFIDSQLLEFIQSADHLWSSPGSATPGLSSGCRDRSLPGRLTSQAVPASILLLCAVPAFEAAGCGTFRRNGLSGSTPGRSSARKAVWDSISDAGAYHIYRRRTIHQCPFQVGAS